jgi:hypothetical protein
VDLRKSHHRVVAADSILKEIRDGVNLCSLRHTKATKASLLNHHLSNITELSREDTISAAHHQVSAIRDKSDLLGHLKASFEDSLNKVESRTHL